MPSFKTNVNLKMDTKGLALLRKRLVSQKSQIVEVGHFDGKQHYISSTPITIAEISVINQLGTQKIPKRNYMRKAMESRAFVKRYNLAITKILVGKSTIAKELPKLGRYLRDIMMGVIQQNDWDVQNSAETIRNKGFNHPLIHTGTLVNDIEFRMINDVGRKRKKGFQGL